MAIVNILESVNGTMLEGASAFGAESELREPRTNAAVIKPGRLCTRDSHDRKVKLPTSAAEVRACRGVTELTDTQPLNSSGEYPVNTRLSVIRKGVVWMLAVDAVVQGGDVYVYYGAGDTALRGRVGGAFSSGQNVKLPGAKFFTSGDAATMVAVEFDLPGESVSESATGRYMVAQVLITAGVPSLVAAISGLSITDTTTGTFKLTVAGATSVLPAGQPILERATDSTTDALPMICEVSVLAATEVTYVTLVQQAADQLFDVADLTTLSTIYVPLFVTYA